MAWAPNSKKQLDLGYIPHKGQKSLGESTNMFVYGFKPRMIRRINSFKEYFKKLFGIKGE